MVIAVPNSVSGLFASWKQVYRNDKETGIFVPMTQVSMVLGVIADARKAAR